MPSSPSPALDDNPDLCHNVVDIFQSIKSLHMMLASVMAEMSAIRNTILSDPTFAVAYRTNLTEAFATSRPIVAEAVRSYDDLIRRTSELVALKEIRTANSASQ